jgi:hypothetical protein
MYALQFVSAAGMVVTCEAHIRHEVSYKQDLLAFMGFTFGSGIVRRVLKPPRNPGENKLLRMLHASKPPNPARQKGIADAPSKLRSKIWRHRECLGIAP